MNQRYWVSNYFNSFFCCSVKSGKSRCFLASNLRWDVVLCETENEMRKKKVRWIHLTHNEMRWMRKAGFFLIRGGWRGGREEKTWKNGENWEQKITFRKILLKKKNSKCTSDFSNNVKWENFLLTFLQRLRLKFRSSLRTAQLVSAFISFLSVVSF